jgi:hypothetical protein
MNDPKIETGDTSAMVGNTVKVEFVTFGNRSVDGKVDTGATTSSLHATDIKVNQQQRTVSFHSPSLSDNIVTLDLAGVQEVHSADNGGEPRPMVSLDVAIDGKPINGATFNLNDRSKMDTQILIGQNILKAGGFVIDPNKDGEAADHNPNDAAHQATAEPRIRNEAAILEAMELLAEADISFSDLLKYLQTAAINRIKE